MKRFLTYAALATVLLIAIAFTQNSSWFAPPRKGRPTLLAHRGLAQTYNPTGVTATTCTAERINPPEHSYIENTIGSMEAAFAAGADIVEFDIHPTTDGQFAVFHDWTLDCRTDGAGVTREKSLAELKALDVGFGYTADGGKTYPFRGKGVGFMPSLEDVLAHFPDRRFLIHIKSNDPEEGKMLADRLLKVSPEQRARLMVYGGDEPVSIVRERMPAMRTMSYAAEKRCLLRYMAIGWSGYTPKDCARMLLIIPANYVGWLWGWPGRFIDRMRALDSEVFVAGPLEGGDVSSGIDRAGQFVALKPTLPVGIWTNRIDRIAPLAHEASR